MLNIYCDHPTSDNIHVFWSTSFNAGVHTAASMDMLSAVRHWCVNTYLAVIFQKIFLGVLRGKCFQYISISIFENWVLQHRYWMTESLNLYPLMAADDDDEVKGHYKMITEKQKLSHKRHKILQIFFRL